MNRRFSTNLVGKPRSCPWKRLGPGQILRGSFRCSHLKCGSILQGLSNSREVRAATLESSLLFVSTFLLKTTAVIADVQRIRSRRRGCNEADFLNCNAWYFVRFGRWTWEGTCYHFSTGRNTVGTMGGKSRVWDRGRGVFRAAWYWFQWTNQSRSYQGGLEENQRGARDASSGRSFGTKFLAGIFTLALTPKLPTHFPTSCIAFL